MIDLRAMKDFMIIRLSRWALNLAHRLLSKSMFKTWPKVMHHSRITLGLNQQDQ